MDREAQRHASQLAFEASGADLRIGDATALPLPLDTLQSLKPGDAHVVEAFTEGLTAWVYHIRVDGKDYNVKIKRPQSLVKNVDGQTSFLNEVQRRRDFNRLQQGTHEPGIEHIVHTLYASYREGIMVSPWIEGGVLQNFNERTLSQVLNAAVAVELSGFLEWDLCPGNILDDGNKVWLFDFGYCFPFDPLTEYNSNGLRDPLFHSVERFETRNFFGHLLKLESQWSHAEIRSLFELEKRLALEAFQHKYQVLKQRGACEAVLSWIERICERWQGALSSAARLDDLMLVEGYRSHLIDIYDDLHGQSCTPMTLKKVAKVKEILTEHFELLLKHDGLFFGDESKTQAELLARVDEHLMKANKYQLG